VLGVAVGAVLAQPDAVAEAAAAHHHAGGALGRAGEDQREYGCEQQDLAHGVS
jgi:hypothetical protein